MGRTVEAASEDDDVTSGNAWVNYLGGWMRKRDLSNAALARATGFGESQISRWRRGITVPDVPSCRRIARVLHRPMLEVLVAAGHLEPSEARLKEAPEVPPQLTEEAQRVQRLQRVMNDPKTPDTVRDRLRALLDIADDQVERARERA